MWSIGPLSRLVLERCLGCVEPLMALEVAAVLAMSHAVVLLVRWLLFLRLLLVLVPLPLRPFAAR